MSGIQNDCPLSSDPLVIAAQDRFATDVLRAGCAYAKRLVGIFVDNVRARFPQFKDDRTAVRMRVAYDFHKAKRDAKLWGPVGYVIGSTMEKSALAVLPVLFRDPGFMERAERKFFKELDRIMAFAHYKDTPAVNDALAAVNVARAASDGMSTNAKSRCLFYFTMEQTGFKGFALRKSDFEPLHPHLAILKMVYNAGWDEPGKLDAQKKSEPCAKKPREE